MLEGRDTQLGQNAIRGDCMHANDWVVEAVSVPIFGGWFKGRMK